MDFQFVAIALGDIAWIATAFGLGFLAHLFRLPPLVGFLAAGFVLNEFGFSGGQLLQSLADLGITLLLFCVGLKVNLKTLLRPQVWAVTTLHTSLSTLLLFCGLSTLSLVGIPLFSALSWQSALLLGFALSFSSTVFAVKVLEAKGEMKSLHGRIAIGVLVMQDIAAVIFLALSTAQWPSATALLLLLLIPARPLLGQLLAKTGHGELLVLYGLALALGSAELFGLFGVKDDLGALVMGMVIASYPKAAELAKSMLNLKELFLVGFFLSIGLTGSLSPTMVLLSLALLPFIALKSGLLFLLMTRFKLRARTALLATISLSNYSEFGLIVAAIGVANGWLAADWLVVIAIALSISFAITSPLTSKDDTIYSRFHSFWMRFQQSTRLADDQLIETADAAIAIFGMGRVGTGAYDSMRLTQEKNLIGVDFDADKVAWHCQQGRNVIRGTPSDADFWDQLGNDHCIQLVMLALPTLSANLDALERLRAMEFSGSVAATVRYPDEEEQLLEAGATAVFNIYEEAGEGFTKHVLEAGLNPVEQ